MTKRGSFDIVRDIIKILSKEKGLSVQQIALKINAQWETTINSLDFMKEVGLVKENDGKKSYRNERIFILVKK